MTQPERIQIKQFIRGVPLPPERRSYLQELANAMQRKNPNISSMFVLRHLSKAIYAMTEGVQV